MELVTLVVFEELHRKSKIDKSIKVTDEHALITKRLINHGNCVEC